ncbi:MAG TPA: hypothetical protein PLB12_05120 [Candidatus Goldiibacteriota bacterium]|nr:hypothetical protein [Candidatus Goldiibacteriota bacterium]HPN64822.1 hypothetical protein [Candidatus Goldiibacteriota bacterium]HRQ43714.1 hypothetical protein [Candidatus Goldiibacteriota bacterium]
MRTITVTLKMDRAKKEAFYNYCHEQGLIVGKFFEKAAENEMERQLIAKSRDVFANFEKQKKTAVDFDEVVKTLGIKSK